MNKMIILGVIGGIAAVYFVLSRKNKAANKENIGKKSEKTAVNKEQADEFSRKEDNSTELSVKEAEISMTAEKSRAAESISERHKAAAAVMKESLENIYSEQPDESKENYPDESKENYDEKLNDVSDELDKLLGE